MRTGERAHHSTDVGAGVVPDQDDRGTYLPVRGGDQAGVIGFGATRVPPPAMGRVLGLDRASEVKTIRRKTGELAAAGKAADLQMAIARHRAQARPDELAFMYVDGHTRANFGKRDVQKMHVARLKFPGPATEETWVTDGAGDPLLVVMAEPSASLAAQIKELLPTLRQIAGPDRKPTLCFDRGGWSPDLFADIIAAEFHLLTYRKASPGKDIPALPADQFSVVTGTGDDGRPLQYQLAESAAGLAITKGKCKGETITLRQVTRLDKGRQVHVLTDRDPGDLPAAGVIYAVVCGNIHSPASLPMKYAVSSALSAITAGANRGYCAKGVSKRLRTC